MEKKRERMRVLELSWDLNEGEKGKKGGGDRDRNVYGGDSVEKEQKKKKNPTYGWNEKKEKRNNIKNKKSYLRNVTTIFSQ